jgi:3-dehydrosphinganine reductase
MTSTRFADKHVVITGGSSGIGEASAKLFAAEGALVTIIARRQSMLDAAAANIAGVSGGAASRVLAISADVTRRDELDTAIADAVRTFGTPEVLLCCAGVARPGYFEDLSPEDFRTAMDTNYFGTLFAVQSLLSGMRAAGRGHVVLVASGAALTGLFGYAAYGPSKFAVRGLAETLRAELAHTGVRASVVYLPDVDTPQLAEENLTKPPELQAIADSAQVWSADEAARVIRRGIERGSFVITRGAQMRILIRGHSLLAPLLHRYFDGQSRKVARRDPERAGSEVVHDVAVNGGSTQDQHQFTDSSQERE